MSVCGDYRGNNNLKKKIIIISGTYVARLISAHTQEQFAIDGSAYRVPV